ncbi:hypothetical protein IGI04_014812 [Brassica rapa subsp. trilocularis]|uniref:Copine C-terminal domain-containing protein n=1 Tax=Brassica rapa subsp. trilocularis TaxID=1813537 RepID=A0ABQ7MNW7_BRACM|nr:hypothetical protein IGI04_014812 [Brassica rapa subsp. trilocularis]
MINEAPVTHWTCVNLNFSTLRLELAKTFCQELIGKCSKAANLQIFIVILLDTTGKIKKICETELGIVS